MKRRSWRALGLIAALLLPGLGSARADDAQHELAQKLINPLASLVSVPLQYNVDRGIGHLDAERVQVNLQPVVPIELGERWKVISRTVVPLVSQEGAIADAGRREGMGDVTQSLFFTPKSPVAGGWLIGAGPIVQLPTGTDRRLSTGKWSVGPTAVAVRQSGAWTYGGLANHLWSITGDGARSAVSSSFVQPFVGYLTRTHTTIALNAEATYDWTGAAWSVPFHATVTQLLKLGPRPLSLSVAARYWAESPEGGPSGWGLRFGVTLLFGEGPS